MEIFKIAAFVAIAAVVVVLLRQYQPSYAVVCITACSALLLIYLVNLAQPVLLWVRQLTSGFDGESTRCVLKAVGIVLVAQNMQDVCRDAGMNALAGNVELAGRCLVLICALPMFERIMGELLPFLK